MTTSHPGTITYVDADAQTQKVQSAADVPEPLRFADTTSGKVPVVKVVARIAGGQRFIREYGPNGELLRSTVQRRS
jgi:hypothetical protein